MSQHATQLNAEDGTYFKKHASYEEGLEYVCNQMGHMNISDSLGDDNQYRDDYGRSIWLMPCSDIQYDAMVDNEVKYGRFVQES